MRRSANFVVSIFFLVIAGCAKNGIQSKSPALSDNGGKAPNEIFYQIDPSYRCEDGSQPAYRRVIRSGVLVDGCGGAATPVAAIDLRISNAFSLAAYRDAIFEKRAEAPVAGESRYYETYCVAVDPSVKFEIGVRYGGKPTELKAHRYSLGEGIVDQAVTRSNQGQKRTYASIDSDLVVDFAAPIENGTGYSGIFQRTGSRVTIKCRALK